MPRQTMRPRKVDQLDRLSRVAGRAPECATCGSIIGSSHSPSCPQLDGGLAEHVTAPPLGSIADQIEQEWYR